MGLRVRAAIAAALAAALAAPPAAAWMPETHRRIAADAAALLPAPLQARLGSLADLREGAVYPDTILVGGEHHLYCIETYCGDAPETVAAEYRELLEDFRRAGPLDLLAAAAAALFPAGCSAKRDDTGLDPARAGNLAFRCGAATHYLADLSVPYHTLPYVEPVKTRHLAFENEVDALLPGLAAEGDGLDDLGGDPAGAAIASARAARAELALVDDPAVDHASAAYRDAIARCYGRAVNAVADLLYSVLIRLPER